MASMITALLRTPGAFGNFNRMLRSKQNRKYAVRWLRSLRPGYLLGEGVPWITFDAKDYLEKHLKSDIKVFEYGSGGSTIFWKRFNAKCVSVEHDQSWHELVETRLSQTSGYEVDYRFVPPEKAINNIDYNEANAALPDNYLSTDGAFVGYTFRNYASQIDSFPESSIDVVLIDGRARPSCILHSVSKVKIGGYLVLDNAERLYYTTHTAHLLINYHCRSFHGIGPVGISPWKTNIYIRRD
jgi:hypothetical protein